MDLSCTAIVGDIIQFTEHLRGTRRCFESRRDRRLRQLCAVHKVVSFYPLKLYRDAPTRIDGICQPQHTMLSRIDLLNDSTTRAPDFAPLHPVCRSSRSLLWPRKSVHDLSLVRVIRIRGFQNTQFCGDESKEEQNHEVYNMASISYFGYCEPHGSFYRQDVRSIILAGTNELKTSRIKALRSGVFEPPDSQPT